MAYSQTTTLGIPYQTIVTGSQADTDNFDVAMQAAETAILSRFPIQSTSLTPAVGTVGADVWVMKTIVSAPSGVFGVPTGTPVNGQVINYILLDDGNGPWALDMVTAACFTPIGVVLPTTTADAKITAVSARWHSGRGKWLVLGVTQEA